MRPETGKGLILDTILLMHDRLAITVVMFMFAVGLWGLFSFISGGVLGGSISGALVIGQILITIQVVLGLILLTDGFRPLSNIHYLYGVTGIIAMPFAYSYLQKRAPREALLFFSLVALFIGGECLRPDTTGG